MKLAIGFQDKVVGYGTSQPNNSVTWEGDTYQLELLAQNYDEVGEDLLRAMKERMRGYWWAEEVK